MKTLTKLSAVITTANTLKALIILAVFGLLVASNTLEAKPKITFMPNAQGVITKEEVSSKLLALIGQSPYSDPFFARRNINHTPAFGDGTTSIGDSAFYHCCFTSIILPETITEIGNYAFIDCSRLLEVFMLNETPPTLGIDAFKDAGVIINPPNQLIPFILRVPNEDAVDTYVNTT